MEFLKPCQAFYQLFSTDYLVTASALSCAWGDMFVRTTPITDFWVPPCRVFENQVVHLIGPGPIIVPAEYCTTVVHRVEEGDFIALALVTRLDFSASVIHL